MATKPLHIVALNWRDLKNPLGGGAEVHLEEILRYIATQGHRCTLITSHFKGAAKDEMVNGYRIIRGGSEFTFNYAVPFLLQRLASKDPPDIVLDDINKIPFYSPLFTKAPVLAIIPHLMGNTVFQEVNPVIASYVYVMEKPVKWVYRDCHFEVISESTRRDLIARGHKAENISVVLCGMDHRIYNLNNLTPKTAHPSLIYLGRIKRYKSVDHVVRALPVIREKLPDCTLTIVGGGDGLPELHSLVEKLKLKDVVRFVGFVPWAEKVRLLQESHLAINPSVKEGWGLTNIEANACGTVCVAADSPGLRDSVLDGKTGLLYPYGDIPALADRAVRLLQDRALREEMSKAALEWSSSLTWERCGQETLTLIEDLLSKRK